MSEGESVESTLLTAFKQANTEKRLFLLKEPEIWAQVVGFEGKYWVSSLGQVRSAKKILTLYVNPGGYQSFGATRHSKVKTLLVHQEVLKAFIGLPENRQKITRHLDGNRKNNALSNLCWGTQKENMDDARRHGTGTASGKSNGGSFYNIGPKVLASLLDGTLSASTVSRRKKIPLRIVELMVEHKKYGYGVFNRKRR